MSNLVQKPEVAIILCAYSRPGRLQMAIESILCQEYTNYRIIIINDDLWDEKRLSLGIAD